MSRLPVGSPLFFAVAGGVVLAVAVACSTPSGAGGASAGSRGEKFFLTKCNACHPGGGQGAGPPIDAGIAPSFLERGKTSGRHGVPEAEFDTLIAYLNQKLGAPAVATAPATTPATGPVATTPVATAPVATAPVAMSGDPARGERYFQSKCNRCHPNGGAGVGPTTVGKPMPGPLKATPTGGRHDVPADEFDSLLAFLVSKGGGPVAAPVATAPVTAPVATAPVATAPSASGDPAQGGAYYQAKCNKCHPGGNKGVGPALAGKNLPGVLVAGGPGKHGVEAGSFENLLSYLTTLGAVRVGGGPTTTAPAQTPVGTTPVSTPPATTTTTNGISNNAGMVPYSCSCQCPAGTPAAALPAACICQCAPR